MTHYFIDQYSDLDSPVHRLSPGVKVAFALVALPVLLSLTPCHSVWAYPTYFVFLSAMVFLSRIPLRFLAKRTLVILPFLAMICALNLVAAKAGLRQFGLTMVRSLLSLWTILLVVSSTRFYRILGTLRKWRVPVLLVFLLSFAYRYFFVLADEFHGLKRALKLRSFRGSKMEFFGVLSRVTGLLFVRSYERAERIYYAMAMRGFDGDLGML